MLSRAESDPQSPVEAKEVKEVFVRLGRIMLLQVSGHEIGTTREHPFWVKDRGWVTAGELKEGDLLAGEADGRWLAVERLEDTGRLETVYNLRVQDYHTYFVGSEEWGFSVSAHNASCSAGEAPKPEVMPGAEARTRPGNSGRGTPKRPGFKPKMPPAGTRAINEHPDTKNIVHQIKRNLQEDGVGPASYVGVAPNGDIIVSNPDGTASNLGSWWHYR